MLEQEWKGAEWEEWKRHQQTKAFLAFLEATVKDTQDRWLSSDYMSPNFQQLMLLQAGALGSAQSLQRLIDRIERIGEGNGSEK